MSRLYARNSISKFPMRSVDRLAHVCNVSINMRASEWITAAATQIPLLWAVSVLTPLRRAGPFISGGPLGLSAWNALAALINSSPARKLGWHLTVGGQNFSEVGRLTHSTVSPPREEHFCSIHLPSLWVFGNTTSGSEFFLNGVRKNKDFWWTLAERRDLGDY